MDDSKIGEFSSSGQAFIIESEEGDTANVPFKKLSDNNTATYSVAALMAEIAYKFITTDGKTGQAIHINISQADVEFR